MVYRIKTVNGTFIQKSNENRTSEISIEFLGP